MDAVLGGSKLTSLPNMTNIRSETVATPYGAPSAAISIGSVGGREVAFLPRHGNPHMFAPHTINYRANMWALKELGVTRVFSVATSGGIRSTFRAGDFVVPDQVIDYTHGRADTYFDGSDGKAVHHIDFTQPYDENVRVAILNAVKAAGETAHDDGCYGAINGPRLETAAEIRMLARDGCDLVGQTGMPEAALAAELGLAYAALCPIVNPAAGIGDSASAISREEIVRIRETMFVRIERILEAFVSI
jgi:5'-methylthioinosine phosphorylase